MDALHRVLNDLPVQQFYWPAMLMSAGLSVPDTVFGHGFLTKDGMKMGKSLGNTLEPKDLVERYGADAVRYFFLREVEFGNDGDYSAERFINIVNGHLANTIAFDSLAATDGSLFRDNIENLVDNAQHQYKNLLLSSTCETVLEIGNLGNLYVDEQAHGPVSSKGSHK
ncbi:methionine--tRNA ligase, chloroplastic/mitochondrial-like [Miscanthus floridulus]|uniref:methionine--tRNA ligase, chloroplastic/mitochondrial-like n=1 Tax=Miscanthus floridulus TaxID=154761 RepID=UPI0034594CA6